MLMPLMVAALALLAAEPPNPIAPMPAEALASVRAFEGRVTRNLSILKVALRPDQSLMAEIKADHPHLYQVRMLDEVGRGLFVVQIIKVGEKVFLMNRRHQAMDVHLRIETPVSMTNEPYRLVLCEIKTDVALAPTPEPKPKD